MKQITEKLKKHPKSSEKVRKHEKQIAIQIQDKRDRCVLTIGFRKFTILVWLGNQEPR